MEMGHLEWMPVTASMPQSMQILARPEQVSSGLPTTATTHLDSALGHSLDASASITPLPSTLAAVNVPAAQTGLANTNHGLDSSHMLPQDLSPPITPPPLHLVQHHAVLPPVTVANGPAVMDNDVFAFYQDRPRSLSISTTISDNADPSNASPELHALSSLPLNSLSDHYAALSISLLMHHRKSLGSQDTPSIHVLQADIDQVPAIVSPISIGRVNDPARSSSMAISAPSSRRRSRSILSTCPYPPQLGTTSSHSAQARSPKIPHLGSPQSLLAVPTGMVHKASVSSSAPSQKTPYLCTSCGKKYKHPNCLAKHRWEHIDHWKETSKLSISKHQQVQLLEAASVLIGFSVEPGKMVFDKNLNPTSIINTPRQSNSNSSVDDDDVDGYVDEGSSSSLDIDIERLSDDDRVGLAAHALDMT
ncbi:hypothetical protein BASA83_002559 [Batrachochytrium salamandrivorans]|nr:hypothetical protein BASA83_002559 [Batrachochytrium salamandrivorans]